jgi:transcriptional regulator GlxA family with amidase domain
MATALPHAIYNTPSQGISSAIPGLIAAAVASFDADRAASRRYLLRASALLHAEREPSRSSESFRRMGSRGALLPWQLNRVIEYIEAHLADTIAAADLAGLINVSLGQLFRAFKLSMGVTPFRYVTKRRVELASTMMTTTEEPLSYIALACGLCDQSHLCKVFRRINGMSPSAWRRAMPNHESGVNS